VGSLLRWWRAPFWLLALGTGAKSFADNPIIGSEWLNRRGLHAARVRLAHRMAALRRRRLVAAVPAEWRERFDCDGFVAVRDFLPREIFARLQAELLYGEFISREQQQGDTITRRVPVGPELLTAAPYLRNMLRSRRWRSLLAYVATTRSEPLYYVQTICSGAVDGPSDPQVELHSDTFHPSMKAWLFLTDVKQEDGPLTYVAGSHRPTPDRVAWEQAKSVTIRDADRLSQRGSLRIKAEELISLGLPAPTAFVVPANTLVVIDTCGFHARGPSSGPSVRAEIWAYCRRGPFLPWIGLDLLSWRPFAVRRAGWLLRVVDVLDRFGVMKQHWRPAGWRRPIDSHA
jgi:phytanoyl-CoA dioxygenase PhyH